MQRSVIRGRLDGPAMKFGPMRVSRPDTKWGNSISPYTILAHGNKPLHLHPNVPLLGFYNALLALTTRSRLQF